MGTNKDNILKAFNEVMEQPLEKQERKPLYWDGETAGRIVKALLARSEVEEKVLD